MRKPACKKYSQVTVQGQDNLLRLKQLISHQQPIATSFSAEE